MGYSILSKCLIVECYSKFRSSMYFMYPEKFHIGYGMHSADVVYCCMILLKLHITQVHIIKLGTLSVRLCQYFMYLIFY